MNEHEKLKKEKFSHSEEDLYYNSGGDVMWSLFKFEGGGVTIYYHDTDSFYILNASDSKWFSLTEIADNWNPALKQLQL